MLPCHFARPPLSVPHVSLSCVREQEFVFCLVELLSYHHWQRELFYSLVLWRDCVDALE